MSRKRLTSRPRPAVPPGVRAALAERSGGRCEAMLEGCLGWATDASHRITVKMGGRPGEAGTVHNRLSNVMHLCRHCHGWVHERNHEAWELGLMLKESEDPATVPVSYRGELVLLADDGTIANFINQETAGHD